MGVYRRLVWPLLGHLDPEWAHRWTLALLGLAQRLAPSRGVLRSIAGRLPAQPVEVCGLRFPNRLGVAAGFDKDARVVRGLVLLGFGHVEVGTLTPRPQAGNPRPRIFRLPADGALINRMGFPNGGVEAAVLRLRRLGPAQARRYVVGASLGKQKETPLAAAADDYARGMAAVYPHVDYVAVNVSSPNTPGLRELQERSHLDGLLGRLREEGSRLVEELGVRRRPLLVKISPDLSPAELDEVVDAADKHGVDGLIATNTTLSREGVSDPRRLEAGGLSGRPLAARSTELVAALRSRAGDRLPIVGVGGVASGADARAKLDAGASLVQLYTGLVYQGPGLAGRILRDLAAG